MCSVFQNNIAITGSIIGVPYVPVVMDGHSVFTNNTGATLRVGLLLECCTLDDVIVHSGYWSYSNPEWNI